MTDGFKKDFAPVWLTAALGLAALVLRRLMYDFALDQRGLLITWHPLAVILWMVTALAAALVLWTARHQTPSVTRKASFHRISALGQGLFGLGIGATVLLCQSPASGRLGTAWKLLGLTAACLLLAGAFAGRRLLFPANVASCVFLAVHIVANYRCWSSDPQLQDYLFALLGAMGLMFYGFYTAAAEVDSANPRVRMGMGLAGLYFSLVQLGDPQYPGLYLGGALWVLTGLLPAARSGDSGETL